MTTCPEGRTVSYSHFDHPSRWDTLFPDLRNRPMFCVEKVDVNGDGILDEVGHLADLKCSYARRHSDSNPCSRHLFLPFTLGGKQEKGEVSVRIASGPNNGQFMTVADGDLVLHPAGFDSAGRLFTTAYVLPFDFSRLVVRKKSGLLELRKKVAQLVNAAWYKLSLFEKAALINNIRAFLANSSSENALTILRWLNERLDAGQRLSEPQMKMLANLAVRYQHIVIQQLTHDGFRWSKRIPLEKYFQAFMGMVPLQSVRYLDAFAHSLFDFDRGSSVASALRDDLSDRITLDAIELFQIERHFGVKELVLGGKDSRRDESKLALGHAMTGAIALDIPAHGFVWSNHYRDEEWRSSIPVELPVLGYYQFTKGALPHTDSTISSPYAVKVVYKDSTNDIISGLHVFYPLELMHVEDDSLVARFANTSIIRPGDSIGITYDVQRGEAYWDFEQRKTEGIVDQIIWKPFDQGSYLLLAHDKFENTFIGPIMNRLSSWPFWLKVD